MKSRLVEQLDEKPSSWATRWNVIQLNNYMKIHLVEQIDER